MVKPIEEYSVSDLTLKKLNDDFYRCQGPMTLSDFPVNLEFLLIEILLFFFDHWSDQLFQNNQHFQAIEFLDQPVPEKLDMGFLFYGQEMLQVECKVDCKTVRFCVFKKCKYARAVKQKVWNEAENRERDWGEARALRARKTLTPSLTVFFTDFEKKTDCFAV